MSINGKTKAVVDGLLTDDDTTETEFKEGLQDVTAELDIIEVEIQEAIALSIALS